MYLYFFSCSSSNFYLTCNIPTPLRNLKLKIIKKKSKILYKQFIYKINKFLLYKYFNNAKFFYININILIYLQELIRVKTFY